VAVLEQNWTFPIFPETSRVCMVAFCPRQNMPEISRFFGMVIAMYYNDHAPPHFHVRYAKQRAVIGIDPILVLAGRLSPRARALVLEWGALHQAELMADWELARQQAPLNRIDPLE
jgi:hypothetical protein